MDIKCRFCRSSEFRSHGYRRNKNGKKRIYKCLSCERTFTPDDGFLRMRFRKDIIVKCLDLMVSGMPVRKIAEYVERNEGVELTHAAILGWKKKYGRMLSEFVGDLKIKNRDKLTLNGDETNLKVNGNFPYCWSTIEKESKYLLSFVLSWRRGYWQARKMFSECKNRMEGDPYMVVTDGFPAYPKAFNKVFFKHSLPRAYHMVSKGMMAREDNNPIERFFGTVKDRTRTMRGGFGSLSSGIDFMNLFAAHYNFVRSHMSLNGKTPAEVAGIDLGLKGNKLLKLIETGADCNAEHKHR